MIAQSASRAAAAARRRRGTFAALAVAAAIGCGGGGHAGPPGHVVVIDIDDHGLAGLWAANAPNIKGLIARGTLAFSRVIVPTHSNQNNIALLTGQYPDGDNVPSNDWLSRALDFTSPVNLPGLSVGDYALYSKNPLLTRGDSVYSAVHAAGGRSAYVGELPPFEAGADDVHLSIIGPTFDTNTSIGTINIDAMAATTLLEGTLGYPPSVVERYAFDGPPDSDETQTQFTLRDAADYVRATSKDHPMPALMFVWDFIALDDDPTSMFGADGQQLEQIIEDYDGGVGELLSALSDTGLLDTTNILFTLDHGKVDTHNQVALGTRGGGGDTPADGQLAALVGGPMGAALGLDTTSYALLNEDGDALIYARVDGAGTAAAAAAQADVTHKLLTLIQGAGLSPIVGLDATRTLTADGAQGTRSFRDFRATSPNQADIVVFPQDDWTLNQVDTVNTTPGPFQEHTAFPFGRHGGFSNDELYVPLIMAGPAFKSGVLLPHPVSHTDVAPTALAALGGAVALRTAARGPIRAAFADDPGETIALPDPPDGARDVVLAGSGFEGALAPLAAPAGVAVLIDAAGLYDDELFTDSALADVAGPVRAVAAGGTRFESCWTTSRDWPVGEYELLTGGLPVSPLVPTAEDDPLQTFAPGAGLLAMPPPPPGQIADTDGYAMWRQATRFAADSLFDAAHDLGFTTALVGATDFHTLHIDTSNIDIQDPAPGPNPGDRLGSIAAQHPHLFAVVVLGSPRTADRHAAAAKAELAALVNSILNVVQGVPGALVAITSRGASTIDDARADFYGPGSSRHVPLVLIGPGVRAGIVTGQPATAADLPATLLYGMGAPTTTDLALGTWAAGPPAGGVPQPSPSAATAGHVLYRAFAAE